MAEHLYCVNVSPVPRFAVIGRFESFISPESLMHSQPAETEQHNMTLGKKKKKEFLPCDVQLDQRSLGLEITLKHGG